ncbi:hypothetical protein LHYA1_G005637 [Lachnellula hyalina]|uniref:Uncharacterized protein n=1 Tax=Lachnellula hyalina TaxID=1316788 RepID=A0A8H8QXT3_9HELO|nr:uncharacterized protein LHYA1_G005637 [Lachnellula hyalina]TVY24728.1 hypothetical protein LHYA1_G005637 [Lachnellula hyalina]
MDQLSHLKNTVTDYLSFAKRRRTIGASTATPVKETEHTFITPASEPTALGTFRDKLYTASTLNPRKRGRSEFEGDGSGLSPNDSVSQLTSSEDEGETEGSGDALVKLEEAIEEDMEEAEMEEEEEEEENADAVTQAKVQEYLARQAELEMRKEEIETARAAGDWHTDELYLFERLTMRSYEELIPVQWKIDFPTLPELLFTDDPVRIFISYNCNSSNRGVKALQELLKLGARVREKVAAGGAPEPLVAREIKRYIQYTEKDGGYSRKRFLPVISVVRARPGEAIDSITQAITSEMTFLAEKHRESLGFHINGESELDANKRVPPLLYGMIVARTNVIFVTLDSANPDATIRHMTHFDFAVKKMDVWNGFAISIMAICARNYTMATKDELEDDDDPESDPDL